MDSSGSVYLSRGLTDGLNDEARGVCVCVYGGLRNTPLSLSIFYENQGERGNINKVKHGGTNGARLLQLGGKYDYTVAHLH